MGMYLNKTGRPIVYSCEWPLQNWIHKTKVHVTDVYTCILRLDVVK